VPNGFASLREGERRPDEAFWRRQRRRQPKKMALQKCKKIVPSSSLMYFEGDRVAREGAVGGRCWDRKRTV
jgi:hypothetical protein